MKSLLKLDIVAYYKYIKLLSKVTNEVLSNLELPGEDVYMMRLAVSEAATNIIEHSYKDEERKTIEYEITLDSDYITFSLRDYGVQVPDNAIKGRDLEDLAEGGLGVFIIDNVMDETRYIHKDIGTQLIMKKKIGENDNDR